MLGSACFLLQLIGEDVLHNNVELVSFFSGGLRMPPAASELDFALYNFSELLQESIYTGQSPNLK